MKLNFLGTIATLFIVGWMVLLIVGVLPMKVYLVQSGSMEPSIMTGDVILVSKVNDYVVSDVVTFTDSTNRMVTHRITSVSKDGSFVSKGDANESNDRETVYTKQIIGKVVLVIPKIGFLVNFMKSMPGFVLLIVVPAVYLLMSELIVIRKVAGNKG